MYKKITKTFIKNGFIRRFTKITFKFKLCYGLNNS